MTIGSDIDARDAATQAALADLTDAVDLARLERQLLAEGLDLVELDLLNVGERTRNLGGEQEALKATIGDLTARVDALENGPLPVPPERPEGLLYDSTLDGWDIWSLYGPGNNETYGQDGGRLGFYTPDMVAAVDGARVLSGVDTGSDPKRFLGGAISTRETGWRFGFGDAPTKATIRFAFDVTIDEYSHAFWPAVWLRGKGGSGVHEVDILEAFTAQTGVDRITQIIHSAGAINYIKAPWPYGSLPAGERRTVWFECDRPGVSGPKPQVRMGVGDAVNVNVQDGRGHLWWADDYWWDAIANIQIGGPWVGDPRNPYEGVLQNGNTAYAKPASEVPTWDGESAMTVHRVVIDAR